jgi:hypothetical protein
MTDSELAWAAGLFEGEGSVRISKPASRNLGSLIVSVVNTDRQVLDFFQERWPGHMQPARGLDPTRQRPAWVWLTAALKAATFLRAIEPFLRTDRVREKAALGLWFQSQKRSGRENRTDDYLEQQWVTYWQMAELNLRGVRPPSVLPSIVLPTEERRIW